EVRFNKKVRGGTAGANIQLASGKTVHGVLYKIEEGAFRSLDRYEGVPDHYRRIEVQVTPEGGQPVPAQIYIASKIEKGLRPSATYLQAMLDGAGEHNLPASYIGEIKNAAGAGAEGCLHLTGEPMATMSLPRAASRGGSFLVESCTPEDIFSPAELTDDQKLIGQTAEEFVRNEVVPLI